MNSQDADVKMYFRRKHTLPPSVLLLRVSNNKDRYHRNDLTNNYRSHQPDKRHPPHIVGLHVNNPDIHETSNSTFGWQRYSHKIGRLSPAPDIVYRNTYLEERHQNKSDKNNRHRSSSPSVKVNNSFSYFSSELSSEEEQQQTQPYRTIYDYIHESIRQIEHQRNLKQQNLSFRVQRPQNEDSTFRRVSGDKRSSARTSLSRTTSTTQTKSSLFNNDLKSPQSLVNYINHYRVFHSTTPNQSYEQEQQQESAFSQN